MKNLEGMTFNEIIDWATGEMIVAIGQGKFKDRVSEILQAVNLLAWERVKADSNKESIKGVPKPPRLPPSFDLFLAIVPGDYSRADAQVFRSEKAANEWVDDINQSNSEMQGNGYATIRKVTV